MTYFFRIVFVLFAVLAAGASLAAPPILEISHARPLYVFRAPDQGTQDVTAYSQRLIEGWAKLPPVIHDHAAYSFDISHDWVDLVEFGFLLAALRDNGISVALTAANPERALAISTINDLFSGYSNIVAIHADRPPMQTSSDYGGLSPSEPAPGIRWLLRALDLCTANGRFLSLELSPTDWLRVLGDPALEPVYQGLRYYAPHVVLIHPMENPTVLTTTGALMGLWMEGAGEHWGTSLSPEWFGSTDFVGPGEWGARDPKAHMPPSMYRAMILGTAMAGATVYRFEDAEDLWTGERGYQWAETIAPTLQELVDLGAIPRRDLAAQTALIAYQCGTADAPASPATILAETNAALGSGGLERVVYESTAPRTEPDLFPNRAAHYFVPLLSRNAPIEVAGQFANLVLSGLAYTEDEWTKLLSSIGAAPEESAASIVRVGRTVYVMHTRENAFERQAYTIPDMPAPVRGVKARRTEGGVELTWPFRENDFAYTVYRRVLPELTFEPIARDLDERTYLDTTDHASETVAYALTALTNEPEPLEGAVNWGEYRIYSAAVSRIEEEVIVLPETEVAVSAPVAFVSRDFPAEQPLWPAIGGLPDEDTETALQVSARVEQLQHAVANEDAEFAAGVFAREYAGADGSNAAFAASFFAAFFERYDHCSLFVQPTDWFVEKVDEPRVVISAYVHLSGVAIEGELPVLHSVPSPRGGAVRLTFASRDGEWRVVAADAPFPSLADVAP